MKTSLEIFPSFSSRRMYCSPQPLARAIREELKISLFHNEVPQADKYPSRVWTLAFKAAPTRSAAIGDEVARMQRLSSHAHPTWWCCDSYTKVCAVAAIVFQTSARQVRVERFHQK